MTGKVVNLRTFRKARARAEDADKASENRRKFGRTRQEKALAEAEKQRLDSTLDAARREPDGD